MKNISTATRNAVAKALKVVNTSYVPSIPIEIINEALKANDLVLLQEDNTEFQGFFCGANGSCLLSLGTISSKEINWLGYEVFKPLKSCLSLSWYKVSTKYEIVAYIS